MKISETWLREWVDPDLDSAALAHQMTMLGLEVDGIEPAGEALDGVLVGKVESVRPHPNADRLRLCRVDVGPAGMLSIVCGAANVMAGRHYPVALIGAVLPGGLKIRKSKLRGEVSEGMLCSAVEIGLADEADGLLELGGDNAPGTPVAAALDLGDHIFDLDLTPNRADCFSVAGVARDIAASQGLTFEGPAVSAVEPGGADTFPVELTEGAGCGRFVGRIVRGIDPAALSPWWLRERLRRSGVRPISPVVDVTNFVMLELGQPLHAYDLARLAGGIVVRRAKDGERLTLLDGQQVTLDPQVLVIADHSGAIGMGGIMGGQSTAVTRDTVDIFFEAAFFEPDVIAGRARRYGMHTDASLRFERGVDPNGQRRAIERATELLTSIAGGVPAPVTEVALSAHLPCAPTVILRRSRLDALLGVRIDDADVVRLLTALGMQVEIMDGGWSVIPPTTRFDIGIEADLIEEIVRLYGYDRIPETPGRQSANLGTSSESRVGSARLRPALVARGYREVITYSFIGAGAGDAFGGDDTGLALSNPISSELAVMRQTLWPGLLQALQHNLHRQQSRAKLFESGIRFKLQGTDIKEENVISGIIAGSALPEQWGVTARPADFFDMKADIEALFRLTGRADDFEFQPAEHPALRPGRTARIVRDGTEAGWCGELHPALVRERELDSAPQLFELAIAPAFASCPRRYTAISKFPAVRRDLAVIVDRDTPVATLVNTVRESAGPALRDCVVFDIYTGKNVETGSKSVALGLILQDTSRTLKDADVDRIVAAAVECLARECNATIRE